MIQTKKDLGGKCVECGINNLCVLDFDHIDPNNKLEQVGRVGKKRMQEEADKTQLLCRNCHRMKTKQENIDNFSHIESKSKKCKNKKLEFVNSIKLLIGKCQICDLICNNLNTVCFDFDHLEWFEKKINVSQCISKTKIEIIDEIKKTRFLCSNCHTIYNTLNKCSKIGKIYFTETELEDIRSKHDNADEKKMHNEIIVKICDSIEL